MIFKETKLNGAYIIEIDQKKDERGFFARLFCEKEFKEHNLKLQIKQSSISYNKQKGTLRGMHYQASPYEEIKLVSCVKGSIYDVIIDLRIDSPTYCEWFGVELNADRYNMLYIPKNFAHGFQTLKNNTVVLYQMSEFYYPDYGRGIRCDDPKFKIKWPEEIKTLSNKDNSYKFWR